MLINVGSDCHVCHMVVPLDVMLNNKSDIDFNKGTQTVKSWGGMQSPSYQLNLPEKNRYKDT